MKKNTIIFLSILSIIIVSLILTTKSNTEDLSFKVTPEGILKPKNKPENARQLYTIERDLYEINMQKNPITREIPLEEKRNELEVSLFRKKNKIQNELKSVGVYESRGPSNLGGRTRALAIDVADISGNTIIAGGVSSGVFRTTNGGESWTKVSANTEIHNVTSIAQDTRAGFENIWYYSTGEFRGNSATLGSFYYGNGIWKSIDNGVNWEQISVTDSDFTKLDSPFDLINKIEVHPITGDLFIATVNTVFKLSGNTLTILLEDTSSGSDWTDVVITKSGRVYIGIDGSSNNENGVWMSSNGVAAFTRIAQNSTPVDWSSNGRIVLATSDSNENILYALFDNGKAQSNGGTVEADLWRYDNASGNWTNFSSKLPDESGGDSSGNDPFAIQGGYDLVVNVKPDDENFVVIGGTNAYRIINILTSSTFSRIGGYRNNQGYALYDIGGVNHHPDIHVLKFDKVNPQILYSGTDGGVHKTIDINEPVIEWENLNNNYQTYQYYHVALDPTEGGDAIIGGAQDNGTTVGGLSTGQPNKTFMSSIAGGDGVAVALRKFSSNNNQLQPFFGTQNGSIYTRSITNSFREITPDESSSQFVTYFYLDQDNSNTLYYAGLNNLYRTNDAENVTSSTWDDLGTFPISQNIRTLSATRGDYNPITSYLLMGGSSGNIFKLTDPQNIPTLFISDNITPPAASKVNGTIVSGLAIHPTNPDIVLATYSNYGIINIFLTKNATSFVPTWTVVERNLNSHSIRSAAIAEVNGKTVYFVGTARGLYSSEDPLNSDWEIEGVETIGLSLVSSLVYRPSDNVLLVGTHGNGIFETNLSSSLSIQNNTSDGVKMAMYPNPAQLELRFATNDYELDDTTKFLIYDINGKQVKKGNLNNKSIDVSTLSKGIYIVNLKHNNISTSRKFVKN
tara:strand:- start:515 stop:3238 length:2724 start_codon:yes stop_codon:yes gene_type:complete